MKTLLVPLLAVAALTACATHRMSDTERLAMYQANAGEPVRQIRYYKAMGWELVDDEHVVLNMRPKESWLVKVSGPCLEWDTGAPTLLLSTTGPYVTPKLDSILIDGSPVGCPIEEIRPLDVAGLRAARDAAAAQASAGT